MSKEDIAVEKAKNSISEIDEALGAFKDEGEEDLAPLYLVYVLALLISRISGGNPEKMHLASEIFEQAMEMAKRSAAYAEDKRKEYSNG